MDRGDTTSGEETRWSHASTRTDTRKTHVGETALVFSNVCASEELARCIVGGVDWATLCVDTRVEVEIEVKVELELAGTAH